MVLHRPLLRVAIVALASTLTMGGARAGQGAGVSPTSTPANGKVILEPIRFDRYGRIHQGIKDQCQLPERLAEAIKAASPNLLLDHEAQDAAQGPRLSIVIRSITKPRLPITLSGILRSQTEKLGSFTAIRMPGETVDDRFRSAMVGTCKALSTPIDALAADISGFLVAPARNVNLGDPDPF